MKTVEEKLFELAPEFVREVRNLKDAELNDRIAYLVGNLEEVEETQENDEKLQLAKAQSREFSAPYRDARKMLRLKMKFLCQLKK